MAPSGRPSSGKSASFFYLILSVALASFLVSLLPIATAVPAGSGVIGVDLGTEYIKAVLVKPGIPLEIVLTKDSKRKEAAVVAFKPTHGSNPTFPERFYGGDAASLAARFPDDVYANLKMLLGVPMDAGIQGSGSDGHNLVEMYKERYPELNIQAAADGRGTVGFRSSKVGGKDGEKPFLVEELLAMQLKQIKMNAETLGGKGTTIRNIAITFPPFYTAEEKRSVELAAELAGLKIVSMISDGMAVALNYATSRTFPNISDGEKPEYHVVFDMGAGSTSASVLKFQGRTVKDVGKTNKTVQEIHVVGTAWDKTLGGDLLNQVIVDDMVEKLIESKKLGGAVTASQVKNHGKTAAKLWKDSERVRQILSANAETSVSFENLFQEDVNFKYSLSRVTFEKLAQRYIQQVSVPLIDALAMANLKINDIESVILHGGATRTPFVKQALEQGCSGKIRTNVNSDEAAAFGAAFKAASLSPSFRVKEIRTHDTPGYAVDMRWESGGKERKQGIFTPTSEIGALKHLTVKNLEDFALQFSQLFTQNGKPVEALVLQAQTVNLTASAAKLKDHFGCVAVNITTKISVRLSPLNGLPEVVSGSVSCEVQNEKKGVIEDVKDFFGLGSKKLEQEPLEEGGEPIDLDASLSSSTTSSGVTSTSGTTSSSSVPTETVKAPKEPATRVESIPLGFTTTVLGIPPINSNEMERIKDRLKAFDASDLSRLHREEAFNELEGYIYKARDWLEDESFTKATTKDFLQKLEEKVGISGDWLHEDGFSASMKELKEKLKDLKDFVSPVLQRKNEGVVRPRKIQALKGSLDSAKMLIEIMDAQIKADESLFSSSLSAFEAAATESPSNFADAESIISPTTTAASASPSEDSENLDEDNFSSEPSTSTESAPLVKPTLSYSIYSPEDLSAASTLLESITTWLDSKVEEQNKLGESDDPVLSVAEMDVKLKEIEKVLSTILTKQKRPGSGPKTGGKKKANGKEKSKAQKEKLKSKAKSKAKSSGKPKTTGTVMSQKIKETPTSETTSSRDEL